MLQLCLVNILSSAVYFANAPSKLFSEGKLGEPKEEIRNLYGFHTNSSNVNSYVRTHLLHEFNYSMNSSNANIFSPLSIRVISIGTTLDSLP
jgi:hypothetical protein